MNVAFNLNGEAREIVIDDGLDDTFAIVEQVKLKVSEIDSKLVKSPEFVPWVCDGVLNSLADDASEIVLGNAPE